MGGSSLGPEVFAETFGSKPGYPEAACAQLDRPGADPALRSSHRSRRAHCSWCRANPAARSNPTSSSNISTSGPSRPSARRRRQSVSSRSPIPGSSLEKTARNEGFRRVFHGLPSIGGRYSVLSDFGMVPAAAIGIDPRAFLESTAEMVRSCAASAPPVENPGVILGAILGTAPAPRARQGDDHRLPGHRRFRRLARAASRRIDRQARQGHRPGRCRAAGRAGGLRQ